MRITSRRRGLTLGAITASAVVLSSLTIAAAPAQATVTGLGGPVGVLQTVTVTDTGPNLPGQSTCTVLPTINGATQLAVTGTLNNGTLTFQWAPTSIGAATFSLPDCTTSSVIPAANITQVRTSTTISTPNTAQIGVATKVLVTVQSASPSAYAPTGQVVVRNANAAVLATMGLTAGPGTGQSFAYFWFTAPTAGTYFFQATYNGDSNATTSVSPQDTIIATPSGGTISLTAPSTMTQGVPVSLLATVLPNGVQGSVGFTVNGAPISASIPIVNNMASMLWTPNVVGAVTLGASYTTNQGGTGSTSSNVTVVAGPASRDVITLTQPGVGPWAVNGVYTLPNGARFTFAASTLSGAGARVATATRVFSRATPSQWSPETRRRRSRLRTRGTSARVARSACRIRPRARPTRDRTSRGGSPVAATAAGSGIRPTVRSTCSFSGPASAM
ncbi:MAG: hypothetical protein NTX29_10320 [Actinobacteria bacterium]|nr:hypothetical protein [Actinomycetota bacterium]